MFFSNTHKKTASKEAILKGETIICSKKIRLTFHVDRFTSYC
jgi:hypothetical protein